MKQSKNTKEFNSIKSFYEVDQFNPSFKKYIGYLNLNQLSTIFKY